jgi:hypothetical protein
MSWTARSAAVLLAGALVACADAPTGPAPNAAPAPRLATAGGNGGANGGSGPSSLELIEDDYAGGLLDKESANRYREYAVSAPERLPSKYRGASIGKDATYSMVQLAKEWSTLSAATRKEIRDLRANGFGNLKDSVVTAHFVLHYTRQGDWAVPAHDADRDGRPDFIETAATSWEAVWDRQVGQLRYPAPKLTVDALGNPTNKFHVYYKDMPYYGYCVPENVELTATSPVARGTASAWIVVENDFAGFLPNDEDVTGDEPVRSGALKVTQAHEFMHAVQFNLNVYQSGWLMESHATWAEDAVYDDVNDWHWYIDGFLRRPDLPVHNRYVYGSAFFLNWVSERYGQDAPRQIWEAAKTMTAIDAVREVAFGGSWAGLAAFAPAQATLDLSDFTTDAPSLVPVDAGLLLRARHASYPVDATIAAATRQTPNRAPYGLGSNFVEFTPGAAAGDLTLTVDGADGHAWRAYAIVHGDRGRPEVRPIALDGASAGTLTVSGFGGRGATKVTLAVTIADRAGVQVPWRYAARVGAATVAAR